MTEQKKRGRPFAAETRTPISISLKPALLAQIVELQQRVGLGKLSFSSTVEWMLEEFFRQQGGENDAR